MITFLVFIILLHFENVKTFLNIFENIFLFLKAVLYKDSAKRRLYETSICVMLRAEEIWEGFIWTNM